MNAAQPPDSPAAKASCASWWRRPAVWLGLGIITYGVGYLIWYLQTPLGRAPQLDGKENLVLAAQIAAGNLPHEPFYRAMLYPAALALPLKLGWPAEWLPALAAVFGLLCHFAITLAVARLAARLWEGRESARAACLAAALWGFNPVALFYAVDVLDTVPSLALFIWAIDFWVRPGMRGRDSLVGGLLLGLAVAARPNYLPVVLVALVARAWLAGRWKPRLIDSMCWVGTVLPLVILGLLQLGWSGEFRVTPWQGAYNFYAANRPGANGRYFQQQIYFTDLQPGENPARKESEVLYEHETNAPAPPAIGDMNVYWREKAWKGIESDPLAWLKLLAKKTYYLFDDFDQYNNKTFAWHQEHSPWLWWNYLGWGAIFVLAMGAAFGSWRCGEPTMPNAYGAKVAGLLLVGITYAAGVIMYYASGRFRLPLMALLCVPAGGGAVIWLNRNVERMSRKLTLLAVMALTAAVTFSNFFNARDESTFIQDESLSANAAAEVGDDIQAYALAEQVLQRDATRPDARRIAVISYFNLTLAGDKSIESRAGWNLQLTRLQGLEMSDPTLALVAGVAYWKTGDTTQAEKIWTDGATHFGANSMPSRALTAAHALQGEQVVGSLPPDPQMEDYLKRTPTSGAN